MPILAMVKAKRQATLAYKFNPSSYTHSGFIAVNVAEIAPGGRGRRPARHHAGAVDRNERLGA